MSTAARLWIGVGAAVACVGTASAGIVQYPSRAAFNSDFPGATFEDFEEARVADGTFGSMDGPLDASTNNNIFLPGEIVPGLRVDVGESPTFPTNMLISSPGVANYVSHAVSFDAGDTLPPQITIDLLDGNVMAFAMDVTSNPDGNTVSVELFSGATSLGTFNVVGSGAGTFFGVASDSDLITRVTLTNGNWFGVDNIAFAVPAPAGLAVLGAGLLGAMRRRR